jgi:hypothetical protein
MQGVVEDGSKSRRCEHRLRGGGQLAAQEGGEALSGKKELGVFIR